MEKNTEALVESLLGEETVTEGDVHGLTAAMDGFERVYTGPDFEQIWGALQTVKPDVWGHLPGEVVGGLKSKLETARVALAGLVQAGKAAVSKAHAYKPPKDYSGYDSAAHSGAVDSD